MSARSRAVAFSKEVKETVKDDDGEPCEVLRDQWSLYIAPASPSHEAAPSKPWLATELCAGGYEGAPGDQRGVLRWASKTDVPEGVRKASTAMAWSEGADGGVDATDGDAHAQAPGGNASNAAWAIQPPQPVDTQPKPYVAHVVLKPVKPHVAPRPPGVPRASLATVTREEFVVDVRDFLVKKGELPSSGDKYDNFPTQKLNGSQWDLFGFYKAVCSRFGCDNAKESDWSGKIFRETTNATESNDKWSGKMLRGTYDKLLRGYEKAHPEDVRRPLGQSTKAKDTAMAEAGGSGAAKPPVKKRPAAAPPPAAAHAPQKPRRADIPESSSDDDIPVAQLISAAVNAAPLISASAAAAAAAAAFENTAEQVWDADAERTPTPTSEDEEDDEEDEDRNEHMCYFCDDGGQMQMCDGPCRRSFHLDANDGSNGGTVCPGLTLNASQRKRIRQSTEKDKWVCDYCAVDAQPCFICNKPGGTRSGDDKGVVKCGRDDCGKFYHLACVAPRMKERLNEVHLPGVEAPSSQDKRKALKAGAGFDFFCPLHYCATCKKAESPTGQPLVTCRRCPTAFHCRKVNDRGEPMKGVHDGVCESSQLQREYEERVFFPPVVGGPMLYCTQHRIIPELATAKRYDPNNLIKHGKIVKQRRAPVRSPQKQGRAEVSSDEEEREQQRWDSVDVNNLRSVTTSRAPPVPKPKPKRAQAKGKAAAANAWNAVDVANADNAGSMRRRPSLSKTSASGIDADGVRKRVTAARQAAKSHVRPIVDIEKELFRVYPYEKLATDFICPTRQRVQHMVVSYKRAVDLVRSRQYSDAALCLPATLLRNLDIIKSKIQAFTGPYKDKNTYSSFGRNFTQPDHLVQITNALAPLVREGDMILDHSCGENLWLHTAKDMLEAEGFEQLSYCGYDIFLTMRGELFEWTDFMRVTRKTHGHLPPGERLIVGLNPPFGYDSTGQGFNLAYKFMLHAAKQLRPRVMLIITPPVTAAPPGYTLVHEDMTLCAGKAFFFPGSVQLDKVNMGQKGQDALVDQTNNVAPAFRIYIRNEFLPKPPPRITPMVAAMGYGYQWTNSGR